MNRPNDCTWPEVKQRAHYVSWLSAAVGTAALLGLTVDLIVVQLTGGVVGIALTPLVGGCIAVAPLVYRWRKYGEAHAGFLELEHAMQDVFSSATDGSMERFTRIAQFIARIDAAQGYARQVIRNEAKAWLVAHADELTSDEREYVADHLGYLHRR